MSDDAETTLRLERLIPMDPAPLFALWTEPAQLVKWWAPDGYEASVDRLDSKVAGHWRVTMRKPDGDEVATSGVYRIVDPPHRLCFTWAWEGAGGIRGHETEVTVTFEAAPGGTRLVLVQQRFDTKGARDGHGSGWSAAFDRMAAMARA
ncbi:SRPBCC domain-containing protein [Bradyrhizobium sp. Tv2a-2]|uniref:SRPBCC family protein n=1 Tax=Bradyrhizobium sp. Tv2a-2 TaxID=113395 RepID=UPI0003F83293|nr:SRPBCC domain-containing protein [Bradyrhizobium sp. Tv2a-2]